MQVIGLLDARAVLPPAKSTSVPTEHKLRMCGVMPPPSWCVKKRRDDLGIVVLWGV